MRSHLEDKWERKEVYGHMNYSLQLYVATVHSAQQSLLHCLDTLPLRILKSHILKSTTEKHAYSHGNNVNKTSISHDILFFAP
jgi:hypothetical protein